MHIRLYAISKNLGRIARRIRRFLSQRLVGSLKKFTRVIYGVGLIYLLTVFLGIRISKPETVRNASYRYIISCLDTALVLSQTTLLNILLMVMYHTFVRAFYLANSSFLTIHVMTEMSVDRLRYDWNKLSKLKRLFDDDMSIFPALWISLVFVGFLMTWTSVVRGKLDPDSVYVYSYFIAMDSVLALAVILHIEWCNMKLKSLFFAFRDRVVRKKYSKNYKQLLRDIERDYQLDFSAYAMFKLNRTLVLSFVSAMVNFTVLFLQISPK
ncbi:hypothetical protein HDE_12193 [Halotydeus destructor]|nr:hypothetical protein HDE_12193 [Halotydeus destructor]